LVITDDRDDPDMAMEVVAAPMLDEAVSAARNYARWPTISSTPVASRLNGPQ
jgi:hypothetical protein